MGSIRRNNGAVLFPKLVRQIGGENSPDQGTILSCLHLVPLIKFKAKSTFLYADSVECLVGSCQHRFSSIFLLNSYIIKNVRFIYRKNILTSIIGKLIQKLHTRHLNGYLDFSSGVQVIAAPKCEKRVKILGITILKKISLY